MPIGMVMDRFRGRLDYWLMLAGVLLCVGIVGVTASLAYTLKQRGTESETQALARLALVVAEQTDRTFQALDTLHGGILQSMPMDALRSADDLARYAARQEVFESLRNKKQALVFVSAIQLLDAAGNVLVTSRAWPHPTMNVADRKYFRTLAGNDLLNYVSEPVRSQGQGDDQWLIYRLEKIRSPSGAMLGAIATSIQLPYFEKFFGAIMMDNSSSIALLRNDGELLMRVPRIESALGRMLAVSRLIAPDAGTRSGVVRQGKAVDGEERLWASQGLHDYPLTVVTSTTTDRLWAAWRADALPIVLTSLVALLAIGVCVSLGVRQVHVQYGLTARAEHSASHDTLTGLPNRTLFFDQLRQLRRGATASKSSAILLLDLDNFKNINDTLGHPAGDILLKTIGGRLRQTIRKTDLVARLGGDEFAVLQRDISSREEVHVLAKRLAQAVAMPCNLDGYYTSTQVSIGITFVPDDGIDPDTLLMNADLALYTAKAEGRATWSDFAPHMAAQVETRRLIEDAVRNALQNDGFVLHYQPIVSATTCEPTGFEALLRWKNPEKNPWTLEQFIPVAEDTGMIVPIGQWVLETVCKEAAQWADHLHFAANVSARQFNERALVANIIRLVLQNDLQPRQLVLEITETVLLQNTDAIRQALHELRRFGMRIALDDFGTGYASLSHLLQFPTDMIKIDRSFVSNMDTSPEAERIVRTLLDLGSHLGLRVVAEGVENAAQRDFLSAHGCTDLQGYFFGRPMPAEALRARFPSLLRVVDA